METPTDKQYPSLASGLILGPEHHRFRLGEALGEHLFGVIWLARDLSTTPQATVSLLILNPPLLRNSRFVNAFKKQLTLCKSLSHDHIVASYGYFLDRSGLLFSAHEALDGLTLTGLLDKGRGRKLPSAQKRALLGQLALALDAGFGKLRLPHGALTPDQVFINRQGGVKLFGFATAACVESAAGMLNPNALAPGLYQSETATGAAIDRHALAVIAFELLSGALPWPSAGQERDPAKLSRPSRISPDQWSLLQEALAAEDVPRTAGTAAWVRQLFDPKAPKPPARPAPEPPAELLPEDSNLTESQPSAPLRRRLASWLKRLTPAATTDTAAGAGALQMPAWFNPRLAVYAGLFFGGLALGFWLGLWASQRQLDSTREQLLEVARQGADVQTALQALQSSPSGADTALPGLAAASAGLTALPVHHKAETDAAPATVSAAASSADATTRVDKAAGAFRDELDSGGFGPEMVPLPRGSFLMGSDSKLSDDNERPVHRVRIEYGVALARHEVTFEQYDRFADATGRARPDDNGWGRGAIPVVNVSWEDARAYARWLAAESGQPYRLPTEAEWEYAARAGTGTPWWWGTELGSGNAVCDECGSEWDGRQPAPAASLSANPWGLHDLNGNVDEWVQDCYADTYEGAPDDGSSRTAATCEFRVMRGGSWFDIGRLVRSSSRYRHPPGARRSSWGFRVAVNLPN